MKKSKAGRPSKLDKLEQVSVNLSKKEKEFISELASQYGSESQQVRRAVQELMLKFGKEEKIV